MAALATTVSPNSRAIRTLNDNFRTSFVGGALVLTAGVADMAEDVRARFHQNGLVVVVEFGLERRRHQITDEQPQCLVFWTAVLLHKKSA